MIEVAEQTELISQVIDALLHDTFPSSYAVVVPPGFGEEYISDALSERLRAEHRALVARIAIDYIKRPIDYVQELQRQWSIGQPPKRTDNPTVAMMQLIDSVPPHRPAIQVITRFEKFLDVLDASMLGAMRNLETGKKLRSAVFTPFTYAECKRRWQEQGKKLVASNYGDVHNTVTARPLEFEDALRACAQLGIPRHVASFVVEQTGAYPEACFHVAGEWKRRYESQEFTHRVKNDLVTISRARLNRLVAQLDLPEQTRYRAAVASLYFGSRRDDALATLRGHPWSASILNGNELRAEAIGPVAATMVSGQPEERFSTARSLYARGAYRQAAEAMRSNGTGMTSERLLLLHAQAMALLVDPDDGTAGIDTDWERLRKVLGEALELVLAPGAGVAADSIARIRKRQEQLMSSARVIADAARGGDRRIVDALSSASPRSAFWLVFLEVKRAAAFIKNSLATQAALAIPEQVFRLWARWALELEYDAQPSDPAVWDRVRELWPAARIVAAPGAPFPSLDAFVWFAMVRAEQESIPMLARPEPDYHHLQRSLSLLQIRRDQAHAVARCSDRDRKELFELIDRWITALLAPCRGHADQWSLVEFEELVQPLPLLAADGELEWM